MSGKDDQTKNKQQSEAKVFIGPPSGNSKLIARGKETDLYLVTVQIGQCREPAQNSVAVKVYVNDTTIGNVLMVKETKDHTFEVKLNSSVEAIFAVKRVGQDKVDDSLSPIDLTKVKRDGTASKAKNRFEVIVGPLTASNSNPVTFVTYDENFEEAKGTVTFSLGQKATVDGTAVDDENRIYTVPTGDGLTATQPLGRSSMVIKLNSEDTTVLFTHLESGQELQESLLFEP